LQLGNSIRQRRRELSLTQEQLAAKAGMRQRTISDIERSAAARFDTVLRVLAALDLELVIRPRTKSSPRTLRGSSKGTSNRPRPSQGLSQQICTEGKQLLTFDNSL
jgi:HTH-type transcriptional regulator/antitoxin HipB